MKYRSEFKHDFTNPGYLHCVILKTLHGFKVVLSTSIKIGFICFNESPLKMMENAFSFILEALFIFRIFNFSLDFLVM